MSDAPVSRAEAGFVRVAAATPELVLGDPAANALAVERMLERAAAQGCSLAVFPELGLTGYSCADLFRQTVLLDAAHIALRAVAHSTAKYDVAAIVGLPLAVGGRLYNCAAFIAAGEILGVVPKSYLPTYGEFYEGRWFSRGADAPRASASMGALEVPFGTDLLFTPRNMPGAAIGIEICEDLWAPLTPSTNLALAGATLIANLSASDELVGKAAYRRTLVTATSGRLVCGYVYAASGPGESSADVVYSGASMIAENGSLLAEATRFSFDGSLTIADVDLARIAHERLLSSTFGASTPSAPVRRIDFHLPRAESALAADVRHPLPAQPFVPSDPALRAAVCNEILNITATGLARRLRHTGSQKVTIGVSGGIDSAAALLVTDRAFEMLGLPKSNINAISMPGPGTSARTRHNAAALAKALGVHFEEIELGPSLAAHYAAIGQDTTRHDVAYQNAQARERTQILLDRGNQIGAIMVGTGDLTEIALGWSTYGGDHISGYAVLSGVPKTLVRYLVQFAAEQAMGAAAGSVLTDIDATPISPELTPAAGDQPGQSSEAILGPYEIHDFYLFHFARSGASPRRLLALAEVAFAGRYSESQLATVLCTFIERMFANQFKRDAMPDGSKVGTVALSPRGDWRMPPDAVAATWLAQITDKESSR